MANFKGLRKVFMKSFDFWVFLKVVCFDSRCLEFRKNQIMTKYEKVIPVGSVIFLGI